MEKKKNIAVVILSVVVVILSVLVVLFATNIISFNDNIDGINDSDNIVNDNQNQNDSDNTDDDNHDDVQNIINNEGDNNQDVDNNNQINSILDKINGVWGYKDYIIEIRKSDNFFLQGMYGTDGLIAGKIKNIKEISNNKFELEIFSKGCTGDTCLEESEDKTKFIIVEIDSVQNIIINNNNKYQFITNDHSDTSKIGAFFNDIDLKNDGEIDEDILFSLYGIIGIIPIDQYYRNDCLNVAISNNNFKDNFKTIFSWYASLMNLNTYHYKDSKCQSSEECKRAYSCAACTSITKKNAEEILKIYNFDNDFSDFLFPLPVYDDEYFYGSYTNHPEFCEFYVKHDINSFYLNSSDIRIIDNQNVIEYGYADSHSDDNIKNSKNQTVTYDFVKDSDGNYYLSNVNVK